MAVDSTQQHIDIAGIRDGIILLRNGGYRLIFSVSTVNFALKNEEEQNALIFQYQSFLNSLHFPIQIVMQSRRLDLTTYLAKINKIKDGTNNELLKLQMEDYIDFVGQLINVANIMKKTFFVVVEHQPISVKAPSVLDKLFKKEAVVSDLRIPETEFNRHKSELLEKANTVANGLGSMGLHCIQLDTEAIIELFYKIYNPDIAAKQRVSNVNELTSPYVEHESERKDPAAVEKPAEKEEVLDNSSIVAESQKQEQQRKAQEEAAKEGQNQAQEGKEKPEEKPAEKPAQKEPEKPATNAASAPAPANNTAPASAPSTPAEPPKKMDITTPKA